MKIAHVLGLREGEEVVPGQRYGVLYKAADLELPLLQINFRHIAEIENRPIPDDVLSDRELRHAVAIRRTGAHHRTRRGIDVDGFGMQLLLALDVAKATLDEGVHKRNRELEN